MPLRMVSPLSSSVSTWKDGSSWTILLSAMPIFSLAALVLGGDGDGDDRIGEDHGLQGGRVLGVAQGVAGLDVLHADQGDDVAGLGGIDLLAGVGVHLDDAADALGLAGEGVEDRGRPSSGWPE